jgi:hypothetical protein
MEKLKVTASIGNTRNRPIWRVQPVKWLSSRSTQYLMEKLKVTASIGNTRNRPIWRVQPVQTASPVWTSPLSVMRLLIQMDQKHATVYIRLSFGVRCHSLEDASNRHKFGFTYFPFITRHWCYGLGLPDRAVAYIFTSNCIIAPRLCMRT